MNLETVEKLLDETHEAQAYQRVRQSCSAQGIWAPILFLSPYCLGDKRDAIKQSYTGRRGRRASRSQSIAGASCEYPHPSVVLVLPYRMCSSSPTDTRSRAGTRAAQCPHHRASTSYHCRYACHTPCGLTQTDRNPLRRNGAPARTKGRAHTRPHITPRRAHDICIPSFSLFVLENLSYRNHRYMYT
jgi:hypothetical protein